MPTLEFALDPADASRLTQRPGLRAGRSFPIDLTWHDTIDATLAGKGLALCESSVGWQVSRMAPETPGAATTVLADARRAALLNHDLPDGLVALARLTGLRRSLRPSADDAQHQGVEIRLLEAAMTGRQQPAICRVTLSGSAELLQPVAVSLAAEVGLRVPQASLAEAALLPGAATSSAPLAPQVAEGQTVSESLATIAGGQLAVMVYWAAQMPAASSPEPVHQMRVATRRLRSALSVYRDLADCPAVTELIEPLKHCAATLGRARDWDVFIGGTGANLANAFPTEPRCSALLRAAARQQRSAYAALRDYLAGPEFRVLTVGLACAVALRPWDMQGPAETMQRDMRVFAAEVLARRMKQVKAAGRGIGTLPLAALHDLRKDCKKLRYAAEFFQSLFPHRQTKRFLTRLAALQEELGLLNDQAVASGLMGRLGRLEHSYAAGLVEGFSAAHAGPARGHIATAWKRFRAADAFWIG